MRRSLLFATVLVVALVAPPVVTGASVGGDRRSELVRQIGEASEAEAAALRELQGIRHRRSQLSATVADLDARIASAEAETQRIQGRYLALQQQLEETRIELELARDVVLGSAAQLYRSALRGATYDVILVGRPRVLASGDRYLAHVSSQRRVEVRRVGLLRDELHTQERLVAAEKAAAEALEADLEAMRVEQERALASAVGEQRREEGAVSSIQARRRQFERELAILQGTSDSIGAMLRARGSTPQLGAGRCETGPVQGPIVSGFGMRMHPILGYARMHNGVDFDANTGTSIRACTAGTVVLASWQGGYGNTVVIDHGGGMATVYAHQSRLAVGLGQRVGNGAVIGSVGSTGLATGPHLHFEVRIFGNPVNPTGYL